jgi:hypothetical protein
MSNKACAAQRLGAAMTVDRRDQFKLAMYEAYWSNVTRAEDAAWKMIAAYTALIAGLSLALSTIGTAAFVSVLIIFSFMAIAISLNANLWFVRNVGLISNLEMDFLDESDYGVLIPKGYRRKLPFVSTRTFEVWWVMILAFFSSCTTIVLLLFSKIPDITGRILVAELYLSAFILTSMYGWSLMRRYERFKTGAPGRTTVSQT